LLWTKKIKSTVEVDISNHGSPLWAGVEWQLTQALINVVSRFVKRYPGYADLPMPLFENGFQMKLYKKGDHHTWHTDSNHKLCQEIAVIIYLNDGVKGGETLFMAQDHKVKPKRGSILLFPASSQYYHAGARVEAGEKYIVSTYITSCDMFAKNDWLDPRRPYNQTEIELIRKHFAKPPYRWRKPKKNIS